MDGEIIELSDRAALDLARYEQHTIEVVVDRLVRRDGIERRLTDSIETALRLGEGIAEILLMPDAGAKAAGRKSSAVKTAATRLTNAAQPRRGRGRQGGRRRDGSRRLADVREEAPGEQVLTFSQHLACVHCGISLDELAPRSFSFNSPYGACPACNGLGTRFEVDPELVVPNPDLSLSHGAIAPWAGARTEYFSRVLKAVAEAYGFSMDKPWSKLTQGAAQGPPLRRRSRGASTSSTATGTARCAATTPSSRASCPGSSAATPRRTPTGFASRSRATCGRCPARPAAGPRLRPESLAVKVGGRSIAELSALSIRAAHELLGKLELTSREEMIAERVMKEIRARLQFLVDVGLDYLTLDRSAATLAGGEAQRIRLASQIGSGLVGRALRARRAVGRPAPAGQPQADRDLAAPAGHRQHRHRRRARRGDDPDR